MKNYKKFINESISQVTKSYKEKIYDVFNKNGYGVYTRPRANTQPMSKQGLRFFDTPATGSSDNSLVEAELITPTPSTRH